MLVEREVPELAARAAARSLVREMIVLAVKVLLARAAVRLL